MRADIHIDSDLLQQCRKGSSKAFRELVEQLKRPAYYHALSLTGHSDDAMDVSQEAFARAWQNMSSYNPSQPFYPWYYTILRRVALNHLRSRSRRREDIDNGQIDTMLTEAGGPGEDCQSVQYSNLVQQALMHLSIEDREILCLKDMHDHSYRELADIVGVPIGTVMSRLYAARQRFRQLMKESGYEHE
ncbi:MAG: RNA polymerase sigma factor [Pseudohongiella sp.]|uniref:RNA polymerase sigma factor n=1 Tax=Pseudohongiella sp. TaxID=1979412 RepID=UPI0034A09BC3